MDTDRGGYCMIIRLISNEKIAETFGKSRFVDTVENIYEAVKGYSA